MARIVQDKKAPSVRGIGVDERSAALVETDGSVTVVGTGLGIYFFQPSQKPTLCFKGKPLTYRNIAVQRAIPGATFNLRDWKGSGTTSYSLSVEDGVVRSTSKDGNAYDGAFDKPASP